jgi:crotonobetainyl-CoA:carnitine CoA-transferase CaiB-like acyl-CoA transferase
VEQGAFAAIRAGSRRESVPKLIPAAACDYITGYLGAAGAIAALLRRIREGGSWSVEVSLSATAMWLQSLARIEARAIPESWKPGLDVKWESCKMARGQLDFLGPVVEMSRTPPRWQRPPPEPGADPPSWLE